MSDKVITWTLDGATLTAISGQSVAAAMISHGERINRTTRIDNSPRGVFCGIGSCFDCLVVVDGIANQRACITDVREGMSIQTQSGSGT